MFEDCGIRRNQSLWNSDIWRRKQYQASNEQLVTIGVGWTDVGHRRRLCRSFRKLFEGVAGEWLC